ncbi:2-(hydroxymethyl)glutarate dehydrogenase [compost metagenome]
MLGSKFGLNLETVVDILNASTGRNFHTDLILKQNVLSGKFASGFQIALLAKDVKIAADLSKSLSEDTPLLDLMQTRWFDARDDQGPTADYTTAHLSWTKSSKQ